MEKKSVMNELKRQDIWTVVAGVSILFCALTAVGGYEALSISNAMVLAVCCVFGGISKDLKDLCSGLVDED